jgi:hypothetical protein
MSVSKKDSIYLVVDWETRLVYTRAPSASVAYALTLGLLNSYVVALLVEIPHPGDTWNEYDFAAELYQFEYTATGYRFLEFPKERIREDLLRKRELSARRGPCIHSLEIHCRNHLARTAEYLPDNLTAFLHDELRNCDASANVFAKSIEEYAELSAIEPAAACQELQLKLKSSGLVSLRAYALQQKYTTKLNACETEQDFNKVFTEFFEAVYHKAAI